MSAKTVHDWIGNHDGKYVGYRVRVGDRSVSTVGIVTTEEHEEALARRFKNQDVISAENFDDLAFVVEELASSAGWPETAKVLRLHAIGERGTNGPSFTAKHAGSGLVPTDVETGLAALFAAQSEALASAHQTIVHQARIQTRSFEVVTEALSHAQQVNAHTVDSMIEAERHRNDAEFEAMSAGLLSEIDNSEFENPLTSAAADTLRQIAPLIAHQATNGSGAPQLDADTVIEILKADPVLLSTLKADPRLVALVMGPPVAPQGAPKPKTPKPSSEN
jgi:hypothetical protein